MRHRRWILVLSLALAATAAHAQKGADVDIVSGGIGLDAREALAAKARGHTLKLVFALASREYVSDVDVEIAGGGRKPTHHAEGPWLFARLPAGQYTIRATFNGNTQTKTVAVGAQGRKEVNFLWPAAAGVTGERTQP